MHTQYLLVYHRRHRQAVEAVREYPPQPDAETALALVVEAVDAVDGSALMVSTQEEEVVGVFDLVSQEEWYGFDALFSSVDVVAEEEVVGVWRETAVFEQAEEVWVLPVDVSCKLIVFHEIIS